MSDIKTPVTPIDEERVKKLVPSLLAFRHERQYSPPLEQGD